MAVEGNRHMDLFVIALDYNDHYNGNMLNKNMTVAK